MRDRLIKLIRNAPKTDTVYGDIKLDNPVQTLQTIADHLLAEGVIVPPVKVGQTVYTINRKHPKEWKVCFIGYNSQGEFKMHIATEKFTEMLEMWDYNIGKTVFLTREQAETALQERSENGKS